MATTVIHIRNADLSDPDTVYIGRAMPRRRLAGSIWANPFRIGKAGTRDEVIALYRARLAMRPDLLARLPELRGKRLACWCAPDACHGDVLAKLVGEEGE